MITTKLNNNIMKRILNYFAAASVAASSIFVACEEKTPEVSVPSVEFGKLTNVSETEVKAEIIPSEETEAIYWAYAETGTTPDDFTKVEGNNTVEVSMDVEVEKSYTVYAYAENQAGKSETVKKEFTVSRIPAEIIETGTPEITRGGILIPLTLSETTTAVLYAIQPAGSEDELTYMRVNLADIEDGKLFISNAFINENGKYSVSLKAYNDFGESEPVSFEVTYDDSELAQLVKINIENLSPVSMDVKVSMQNGCTKYAIGAFVKSAYNKKEFMESALRSINPDPNMSFLPQPFLVKETDETFSEQNLTKGTKPTDPTCKGIRLIQNTEYTVAVYAIDADGYASVYTQDVTTPAVEFGQCPTTVAITAESTLSSVIPTYTVSGTCSKLVLGYLVKDWVDSDPDGPNGGISDWDDASQIVTYIKGISNEMPVPYEGKPITKESPVVLEAGQEVLIYAFAINDKGQVGQLGYGMFAASRPVLDGEGEVTSLTVEEVTFDNIKLNVQISDKSEKVRIMVIDEGNYHIVSGDLDWTMSDGETNSHWWTELSKAELAEAGNIVNIHANYPETKYYIHAVTVDAVGKVSPVQTFDSVNTPAKEEENPEDADFSGVGEINFQIVKEEVIEEDGIKTIDLTYKVELGANTVKVFRFPIMDITREALEAEIKAAFAGFDPENPQARVTEFTAFGVEQLLPALADYDDTWGGQGVAFITYDTNGKLKIASEYFADSSKIK